MSPAAFAVVPGLIALQRLVELAISQRNLKHCPPAQQVSQCADSPGRWRAMVILNVALLILPAAEATMNGRVAHDALLWPCLGALMLAQLLRIWTMVALGNAWNARGIVPTDLTVVTDGPYRFVRHPNYLAVVIEFMALPLAAGAWFSLGLLNPIAWWLNARRIAGEEALLQQRPGYGVLMTGRPCLFPRLARTS